MKAKHRQLSIPVRKILLDAILRGEQVARIVGATEAWARRQSIMREIEEVFELRVKEGNHV